MMMTTTTVIMLAVLPFKCDLFLEMLSALLDFLDVKKYLFIILNNILLDRILVEFKTKRERP